MKADPRILRDCHLIKYGKTNMMQIVSNSFKTIDSAESPTLWFNYQQGLRSALERFGVNKVVQSSIVKLITSDTYAILSLDANGKALGGIRLEVKSAVNRLPLEKIETAFSGILNQKIAMQSVHNNKLAEICGLWVSEEASGRGLGSKLALEATKLGMHLKMNTLVSMLPAHTLDYFLRLAFVADPDLPQLAYPDDRYLSTVVWFYLSRL